MRAPLGGYVAPGMGETLPVHKEKFAHPEGGRRGRWARANSSASIAPACSHQSDYFGRRTDIDFGGDTSGIRSTWSIHLAAPQPQDISLEIWMQKSFAAISRGGPSRTLLIISAMRVILAEHIV